MPITVRVTNATTANRVLFVALLLLRLVVCGLAAAVLVEAAPLACGEALVIGARLTAHQTATDNVELTADSAELAHDMLRSVHAAREDLISPRMDLAILIAGSLAATTTPTATGLSNLSKWDVLANEDARALGATAPLSARAWCLMAYFEARNNGMTSHASSVLQACYEFGPREINVVEGRLMLALATWDQLPPSIQSAALLDIENGLLDAHFANWMAERLGRAVTTIVPQLASLIEEMLDHYGQRVKPTYARIVDHYRSQNRQVP
jgi:hypothetical protein